MTAAPDDAPSASNDHEPMTKSLRRRKSLQARWRADGERSLVGELARVSALGWLIVVPALGGLALGRWLDRLFHAGIMWTGGLLVAGVAIGCWMAWRRVAGP